MEMVLKTDAIYSTKIKIVGVGGAGVNAVNSMIKSDIQSVEFVVANCDVKDLSKSLASKRIYLGSKLTKGDGAGGIPEIGRRAAEESLEDIEEMLMDTSMLFIAAGMGGGTGTGAAPVIARKAKEMKILTLGIVSLPFDFEGKNRRENACKGIQEIQDVVDTLIVIPNNKMAKIYGKLPFMEAFKRTDDIITNAAHSISDIVNRAGYINIDFADIKSVMSDAGYALMGIGMAEGDDRAMKASKEAIENPLLQDIDLTGCKGLLINVSAGNDFMMDEFDQISEVITSETGKNGNIFIGFTPDDSLEGKVKVTIIATGLSPSEAVKSLQLENINLGFDKKPPMTIEMPPQPPKPPIDDEWKVIRERIKNANNPSEPEPKSPEPAPSINNSGKMFNSIDFKQSDPPAFLKKYFQ
ncbi:MAG: cell division protein FtsZ [Candidatus Cloacimonetes bacterium]|nr:cell division protein FtsZ [Candidatus Cloacimonadota bacterium]